MSDLSGLMVCAWAASAANGATGAWSNALNISDASNVATTGSLLDAENFGGTGVPGVTVNTVPFAAFPVGSGPASVTVGTVTLAGVNGFLFGDNALGGSTAAPFSSLDTSDQTLLSSLVYLSPSEGGGAESVTLTVSGLTVGDTYLAQIFANLSSSANTDGIGIAGGPTLVADTTDTTGGTGQYANGSFVADAATQSFSLDGASGDFGGIGPLPLINAFQIRTTATPEPVTLGAMLLSGVGLLSRRRSSL